jgi:hypothetical protein
LRSSGQESGVELIRFLAGVSIDMSHRALLVALALVCGFIAIMQPLLLRGGVARNCGPPRKLRATFGNIWETK